MTGRTAIETILDLVDEAFHGRGVEASNESQALLANVRSLPMAPFVQPAFR